MNETASRTKLSKAKSQPTLQDATEVVWHKTTIHMYGVAESQLEELTAGYNSLHLIFFGIFIGAAVAFFIAFKQLPDHSSSGPYYVGAVIATAGLALICGINGLTNFIKAYRRKRKLYKESLPIGQP
jgi:hypothetical protein